MYVCICMYACIVCMYVCMHVLCMCVCMCVLCMYVGMHACMHYVGLYIPLQHGLCIAIEAFIKFRAGFISLAD